MAGRKEPTGEAASPAPGPRGRRPRGSGACVGCWGGGGGAAVKQQSARREEGEGERRGGEGKAPAAGSDVPRSPCRAAPTINSLSKHQTTARASESDK